MFSCTEVGPLPLSHLGPDQMLDVGKYELRVLAVRRWSKSPK